MGLCGSLRCGCGISSSPSTEGAIDGYLPSINVSGSGEAGDPYNLTFNDDWAVAVVDSFTAVETDVAAVETDVAALETEINTRGPVGFASIVADTVTTTTTADAGISVTFTAAADRMYQATAFAQMSATVTGDSVGLILATSANTQLQRATSTIPTANRQEGLTVPYIVSGISGSTTWKVRYTRIAGTGDVKIYAAASAFAFLLVEDIGPA